MYETTGILRYVIDDTGHKVYLEVDQEIANYYRSLIPKWIKFNRQYYPPHISVVRHETPVRNWGVHDGKEVEFTYSPVVHFGTVYCWLNAFSVELEKIRLGMGLPVVSKYTVPPEGFEKTFHITLGNCKGGDW